MFGKVLAMVLGAFNLTSLPKGQDGKSTLTLEMKKKLTEDYGQKFVDKFEKDLKESEEKGEIPSSEQITQMQSNLDALKEKFEAATKDWKTKEADLNALIEKLGKEKESEDVEKIPMAGGKRPAFKADMSFTHNKVIDNFFNGDGSMSYSGNETINTTELQTEFGKYISGEKLSFFKDLNLELTVTKYMTTVVTDKTEWRAAKAIIDSVLQQFTPKWTPTGSVEFTPITIKNYFLKVNLPITPSDIIDQYFGYMYDENLTPDQMPIVKFIINVLLRPKLAEDLELALAKAKFVEHTATTDGQAGSSPEDSMDGFLTIIKNLKATAGNKVTWLIEGVELTADNIVDEIEKAADSIPYKYKNKKILIHADPDLIVMYRRGYRKKYPTTKNEDENNLRVDFSNLTFAPVDGMVGTKAFFITPKENFIHLMSRNPNEAKISMQVQNYDVKIFMEFRKGTGFAMQEAIFAYLPPAAEGGDGEDEEGA
ncbi:hypothetical protein E2605_18620 [Dysgonomonas capnocytophagoides]|uniref:Uncharacterized protein n=1 Tax=Dysgonomonas capnocytophagoides TaxID=45254 RepID=A0A4Y8KUV2_9BACT|nr:hypothetical protein [Dysgonomonas capnocytophagoides]TFD92574.1 hypothetical protein E2605_18620 [Dysgonomonas capnocytophagoides]